MATADKRNVQLSVCLVLINRPHCSTTKMRPIVIDRVAWSVCRSVCLPRSWALQKQLNWSRFLLGCGLGWARGTKYYIGCTLTQPGEYEWTVRVRLRCDLVSNYSDYLFIYLKIVHVVTSKTLLLLQRYHSISHQANGLSLLCLVNMLVLLLFLCVRRPLVRRRRS